MPGFKEGTPSGEQPAEKFRLRTKRENVELVQDLIAKSAFKDQLKDLEISEDKINHRLLDEIAKVDRDLSNAIADAVYPEDSEYQEKKYALEKVNRELGNAIDSIYEGKNLVMERKDLFDEELGNRLSEAMEMLVSLKGELEDRLGESKDTED